MADTSSPARQILFYAPTMGIQAPWLQYYLDQAAALARQGDQVRVILSETHGAFAAAQKLISWHPDGLEIIDASFPPAPCDISQRSYTDSEAAALRTWLEYGCLKNFNPAAIVVRGANAPYLELLYPHTPRFNLIEGTLPGLTLPPEVAKTLANDAILARDEGGLTDSRLWGAPFFARHYRQIAAQNELPAEYPAVVAEMAAAVTKSSESPEVAAYVEEVKRTRGAKYAIVFPLEYMSDPENDFVAHHHTLMGSQVANLQRLLDVAGTNCVLLPTYHPRDVGYNADGDLVISPRVPAALRPENLRELSSRITVPMLDPKLRKTGMLTQRLVLATDATAWQGSKTFAYALYMNKPIVDLTGRNAMLGFANPIVVGRPFSGALSVADQLASASGRSVDNAVRDLFIAWTACCHKITWMDNFPASFDRLLARVDEAPHRQYGGLSVDAQRKNLAAHWAAVTGAAMGDYAAHFDTAEINYGSGEISH